MKCGHLKFFPIGITLANVLQNWLNLFHFLFLKGGPLNILIDCMIFLPPFLDVYMNSLFPRTARIWNSLPIEYFPLTYDLSEFKSCGFMLQSFCASFSCNVMPCSGSSVLHGVNSNYKKKELPLLRSLLAIPQNPQLSSFGEVMDSCYISIEKLGSFKPYVMITNLSEIFNSCSNCTNFYFCCRTTNTKRKRN